MMRTNTHRALGWTTLAGGSLLVLFWALYFGGALELANGDPFAADFESAFPVADGVLAVLLFASSFGLFRRKPVGAFGLVCAAAMTLYLGLLDMTFYGLRGAYVPITLAGLFGLTVSSICIAGGLVGLRYGWTLWKEGGCETS